MKVLNNELKNATPDRKKVLLEAIKKAQELAKYCGEHDIGTFVIDTKIGELEWCHGLNTTKMFLDLLSQTEKDHYAILQKLIEKF